MSLLWWFPLRSAGTRMVGNMLNPDNREKSHADRHTTDGTIQAGTQTSERRDATWMGGLGVDCNRLTTWGEK